MEKYEKPQVMETAYAVWSEPPRRWRELASSFFRNMHITTKYSNYFHLLSSLTYR